MTKKAKCKICDSEAALFSKAQILKKYRVEYFQCHNCKFVQTEEPYWLEEAYTQPISSNDYGLIARNIYFVKYVTDIIINFFDKEKTFLDYGCGYGVFVRLMRDVSLKFYGYDPFCQNIFASEYTVENLQNTYELIVAFEVFEHFKNPVQELEQLLKVSDNILFSTIKLPHSNPTPEQWVYYGLDDGQHISIYTTQSLEILAKKFNLNLYSGSWLHLLTRRKLPKYHRSILNLEYSQPQEMYPKLKHILLQELSISEQIYVNKHSITPKQTQRFKIVLDGVFFQRYKSGIARVWESILKEWSQTDFATYITVLDRGGTSPKVSGISYRTIPLHDYNNMEQDREMLQQICNEEVATLFISTYYTTPLTTPSVFIAYDMVPEVIGADFTEPTWREKHNAIEYAISFLSISENTKQDLVKYFPKIDPNLVTVAYCGVDSLFTPATVLEIEKFKQKYGIKAPYFLLISPVTGYKNAPLFFQAFAQLPTRLGFDIVCTGHRGFLEEELRQYVPGNTVHTLQLSDKELRLAYAGAIALVYPSQYEGFGLPVLEALACGCPVITTPNASIPEVAGEVAIYVNSGNVNEMANALCKVQKPNVRNSLITLGLQQAQKFTWSMMAETVRLTLIKATLLPLGLQEVNWIVFPNWSRSEETLRKIFSELLKKIATHQNREKITLLFYMQNWIESSPFWLFYFLMWTINLRIYSLMRYALLAIGCTNWTEEEVNLLLSGIVMNLAIEEGLDFSERTKISYIKPMTEIQWEVLFSQLQKRIILPTENKEAIGRVQANCLPACSLAEL